MKEFLILTFLVFQFACSLKLQCQSTLLASPNSESGEFHVGTYVYRSKAEEKIKLKIYKNHHFSERSNGRSKRKSKGTWNFMNDSLYLRYEVYPPDQRKFWKFKREYSYQTNDQTVKLVRTGEGLYPVNQRGQIIRYAPFRGRLMKLKFFLSTV